MTVMRWSCALLLAGTLAARAGNTGTDPTHKCAWAENVGWANAQSADHDVTVHYYEGTGGWSNVLGQVGIQGVGGQQAMQDTNAATRAFYSVNVTVTP